MAKLLNDERETHINMVHGSNKMKIYTTEYNIVKIPHTQGYVACNTSRS